MKKMILFLSLVSISSLSLATTLESGVYRAYCSTKSDIGEAGFVVYEPSVTVSGGDWLVSVKLDYNICAKKADGTIGFVKAAAPNENDRLLALDWSRLLKLPGVVATINETVDNTQKVSLDLKKQSPIFTAKERKLLATGATFTKSIALHYGNSTALSDGNDVGTYNRSAGNYSLVVEANANSVKVLSMNFVVR